MFDIFIAAGIGIVIVLLIYGAAYGCVWLSEHKPDLFLPAITLIMGMFLVTLLTILVYTIIHGVKPSLKEKHCECCTASSMPVLR